MKRWWLDNSDRRFALFFGTFRQQSNPGRMFLVGSAVVVATGLGAAAFVYGRYQTTNALEQRQHRHLPANEISVFLSAASASVASRNTRTCISTNKEEERGRGEEQNTRKKRQRRRRNVVVVSGGIVGIATAHRLAKAGHRVVVVEPRAGPAMECTACAAGGMQRSNPVIDRTSWMDVVCQCILPTFVSHLFALGNKGGEGDKEPFRFFHISGYQILTDPFFLRWILTFTQTSLFPGRDQHHRQQEMLKFTKYAVDNLVASLAERRMNDACGYNDKGCIWVSTNDPFPTNFLRDASDGDDNQHPNATVSKHPTASKMNYEPSRLLIGTSTILASEPSLRFQEPQPEQAYLEYETKAASAERYAMELVRRCQEDNHLDVTFLYDTKVIAISVVQLENEDNNTNTKKKIARISKLKTNRGVINISENDVQVVVAAGAWTPHVLSLMDLYVPVYPLKGYAMSLSAAEYYAARNKNNNKAYATTSSSQLLYSDDDLPSRIVCDKYMFTTRLGPDEIRITSIGEFSGWDTVPTEHVDRAFRQQATYQFPQLSSAIKQATTRVGHRPLVNDGILLLGAVSDTHENLFVSCGPGSNGWKLCLGSADILERLVSGQGDEEIEQELGFNPAAFSPLGRVFHAPFFAKLCRFRWGI
jgi:glycine/D-amino acid oxidase-like deaminating enzyme